MDNYQCSKCGTLVQSSKNPSAHGCPKGSMHQWTRIGSVGDTNYQCKKCSTLVRMDKAPSAHGCPSGSMHQWTKL
jgi:DNA-directed RNA polymerase subunit RPC12/RpoP